MLLVHLCKFWLYVVLNKDQIFLLFVLVKFVLTLLLNTAAKIGEGILLDHGTGLVIGETAVVGNKVSLMQASVNFLSMHDITICRSLVSHFSPESWVLICFLCMLFDHDG